MGSKQYTPEIEKIIADMAEKAVKDSEQKEKAEVIDTEELQQRVAEKVAQIKAQRNHDSEEKIEIKPTIKPKADEVEDEPLVVEAKPEDVIVSKAKAKIGLIQQPSGITGADITPPVDVAVLEMARILCDGCSKDMKDACSYLPHGECCDDSLEVARRQYERMQDKGLITEQGVTFDPSPSKMNMKTKNDVPKGFLGNLTGGLTGILLSVVLAVAIGFALGYTFYVSKTDFTKNLGDVSTTISQMQTNINNLNIKLQKDEATITNLSNQLQILQSK